MPNGQCNGFINQNIIGFVSGTQCLEDINPDYQGENFNVHALVNLVPSCMLGTIAGINFGTHPGLVERAEAAGSVQLTCPSGLAWTLRFGGGSNASGGTRRMRSAAGYYLPYTLHRNSARDNPIAIDGTVTGTGTNAMQTNNVYGLVEPSTPPPTGCTRIPSWSR